MPAPGPELEHSFRRMVGTPNVDPNLRIDDDSFFLSSLGSSRVVPPRPEVVTSRSLIALSRCSGIQEFFYSHIHLRNYACFLGTPTLY